MNTGALSSTFQATNGDGYERMMGRWSRRLAEPFLDFAGTADHETVLDAGSGTGSLSNAIAARMTGGAVEGVDFADAYVGHAIRASRDPRLSFQQGDVCALPYQDGRFDRVLSLLVLHFVPDSAKAAAEFARVAKPGATVAAAVWDVAGGFVANRILFDTAAMLDPAFEENRTKSFGRPMTRPGELAAAWTAAGLADVKQTTIVTRMEFADFEDFWTPYLGREGPVAAYVEALEEGKRAALTQAVRRAYLGGAPDGPRSFVAAAWAVRGRKPA